MNKKDEDESGGHENIEDNIIVISSDDDSSTPPPSEYYSTVNDLKIKQELISSEQKKSNNKFPLFASFNTNDQAATIETPTQNVVQNDRVMNPGVDMEPQTPESGRASMPSSGCDFDQNDESLLDLRTRTMPKVQSVDRLFSRVPPQQTTTVPIPIISSNFVSNFFSTYSNQSLNTPNTSFASQSPSMNFNYSANIPPTQNSENYKTLSGGGVQNTIFNANQQSNGNYYDGYQRYNPPSTFNVGMQSSSNIPDKPDPQLNTYVTSIVEAKLEEIFQNYDLVPKKKKSNVKTNKLGNSSKKTPLAVRRKEYDQKIQPNVGKKFKLNNSYEHSNSSESDNTQHRPHTSTATSSIYLKSEASPNMFSWSTTTESSSSSTNYSSSQASTPSYYRKNHFKTAVPNKSQKKQDEFRTQNTLPKNIDKSLYLSSANAKICPLCGGHYSRMVYHFKTVHPNCEVFASRISPQMVDNLDKLASSFIKYNNNGQYLRALCVFCEDKRDFSIYYWMDHIRSHSGEYANICTLCQKCVCFNSHCGMHTQRLEQYDILRNNVYAYLCKECHYLQINLANMHSHLKEQHGFEDIDGRFECIILLPAIKSLPFQPNPKNAIVGSQLNAVTEMPSTPTTSASNEQSSQRVDSNIVSPNGIHVLENIIIQPANNDSANEIPSDTLPSGHDAAQTSMNDQNHSTSSENNGDVLNTVREMFKFEKNEVQELLDAAEAYKRSNIAEISVRPWIEGDYAKKPTINRITLFALYKCMHPKCLFATDSEEMWGIHMEKHLKLINAVQQRSLEEQIPFEKIMRDDLIKFRECAYCGRESKANRDVISHMVLEHRRSIFQCAHCYYRTIESDNIVLHYETFHPTNLREILLCGDKREFEDKDEEVLRDGCEQYITKFKCGQDGCYERFACFNSLYVHLAVVHPGKFVCPYCTESMDCDESTIANHLKFHQSSPDEEIHFEEFQCINCEAGYNDINEIKEHMSINHVSSFLFIAARRKEKAYEDAEEDSDIQIVYIGDTKDNGQYTLTKCLDSATLNCMSPNELVINNQMALALEISRNHNHQVTTTFSKAIPPIQFTSNILTYEDYQKIPIRRTNQLTVEIQYKCISRRTADALANDFKDSTGYMSRMCPDCSEFIKLDAESGLEQYLNHLTAPDHYCKKTNDIDNTKDMALHRIKCHPKDHIIYIQIEKSEFLVYKIVQCQFKCQLCQAQFDTRNALESHYIDKHHECFLNADIVVHTLVIKSNDPNQPVATVRESDDFVYITMFVCNQHNLMHGSKEEAFAHYNTEHRQHNNSGHGDGDNFDFSLKRYIIRSTDFKNSKYGSNPTGHNLYQFKCLHCSTIYHSHDLVKKHLSEIRNTNPEARFTMQKLFACPEDKSIRTFDSMKAYCADKHPGKACTPANAQFPNHCGFCNYQYLDVKILAAHYRMNHADGDGITEQQLTSIVIPAQIDTNKCIFVPGCCKQIKINLPSQIVEHFLKCSHRFTCTNCATKFGSLIDFVLHCTTQHRNDANGMEKLIGKLHDIKHYMGLISDTQIYFANGFVVKLGEIRHTTNFGRKLHDKLCSLLMNEWENEKQWLPTFTSMM